MFGLGFEVLGEAGRLVIALAENVVKSVGLLFHF
jgi:hypothetical protein